MSSEKITSAQMAVWKDMLRKDFPLSAPDGTLTLAGVLHSHMFEYDEKGENVGIFRDRWKVETIELYMTICCEKLFPELPRDKGIDTYTVEEFDEVLHRIRVAMNYQASTMNHYILLLARICYAGFVHGHCLDFLWGTRYQMTAGKSKPLVEEKADVLLRIRKSLTEAEEQAILDILFEDPETASGQTVGLAIMCLSAVRNNEACGLNWGDLRRLREFGETQTLWIYKTTAVGKNILKAGGKTRNASRVLPIVAKLGDFLEKRKAFIQSKIDDGTLPVDTKIEDLPMVCRGEDYTTRCKSGDLSVAGRLLFKQIHFEQKRMVYWEIWVQEQSAAKRIEEKDATTYLFRRNFGTHIRNMGFTMAQVQYYMGHDVEDDFETRNGFTNEENLQEMARILKGHPLCMAQGVEKKCVLYLKATCDNDTFLLKANTVVAQDKMVLKVSSVGAVGVVILEN